MRHTTIGVGVHSIRLYRLQDRFNALNHTVRQVGTAGVPQKKLIHRRVVAKTDSKAGVEVVIDSTQASLTTLSHPSY